MSKDVLNVLKNILKKSAEVLEQNTNLDLGLSKERNNNETDNSYETLKRVEISKVDLAASYTERGFIFGKGKFKYANPTYLWDSNDNFGSDLDTVLFYSKNGVAIEPDIYSNIKSHIQFIYDVDDKTDGDLNSQYNRFYGITNLKIEDINNGVFKKHLHAEDSNVYFESYVMEYASKSSDGSILNLTYSIQLILYKNEYSLEELNRLASEYHGIIDTFEVVSFDN